jgi:hypothetical protein
MSRGRPRILDEDVIVKSVKVTEEDIAMAEKLGKGNFSLGVRKAIAIASSAPLGNTMKFEKERLQKLLECNEATRKKLEEELKLLDGIEIKAQELEEERNEGGTKLIEKAKKHLVQVRALTFDPEDQMEYMFSWLEPQKSDFVMAFGSRKKAIDALREAIGPGKWERALEE